MTSNILIAFFYQHFLNDTAFSFQYSDYINGLHYFHLKEILQHYELIIWKPILFKTSLII